MSTFNSRYLLAANLPPAASPIHAGWRGNAKVRPFPFIYDNATENAGATFAQNDLVNLVYLPAGAMIMLGYCSFGDFGTAVTVDIGLYGADGSGYISLDGSTNADDEDWIAAAIDVATAAGTSFFANTAALHQFYVTEKPVLVKAKFEGGNPIDTTCDFRGIIFAAVPD